MNELEILKELEERRAARENDNYGFRDTPDYIFRLCQAIVADHAGYKNRMEWTKAIRKEAGTRKDDCEEPTYITCPACGGDGFIGGDGFSEDTETCPDCGGLGEVLR